MSLQLEEKEWFSCRGEDQCSTSQFPGVGAWELRHRQRCHTRLPAIFFFGSDHHWLPAAQFMTPPPFRPRVGNYPSVSRAGCARFLCGSRGGVGHPNAQGIRFIGAMKCPVACLRASAGRRTRRCPFLPANQTGSPSDSPEGRQTARSSLPHQQPMKLLATRRNERPPVPSGDQCASKFCPALPLLAACPEPSALRARSSILH